MKRDSGNIKIIIAIIILILLIIIGIFVVKNSFSKKEVVIKNEPYEYFTLNSSNGKLGIVDKNGNIVIEPEYENIYIPNQSKDVFICYKDESNYSVINKEGKDIFQDVGNVYSILISDTSLEMEKNVLLYEKDEKFGLIDYDGKKITEPIYEEIISLPNKPGFLRVKKDGLYGVLDSGRKFYNRCKI